MLIAAAFLWGLAEATLFLVVADVFLSLLVVWRGARVALAAALAAALGAVPGAAVMLVWSAYDPAGVLALLERLPAIDAAMIENAGQALAGNWFAAMLAGAFSGVPYKVFAAQAWPAGVGASAFLLATVPLRLARYVVAVVAVAGLDWTLRRRLGRSVRVAILGSVWSLFYAIFWSTFPP